MENGYMWLWATRQMKSHFHELTPRFEALKNEEGATPSFISPKAGTRDPLPFKALLDYS